MTKPTEKDLELLNFLQAKAPMPTLPVSDERERCARIVEEYASTYVVGSRARKELEAVVARILEGW